MEGGIAEVVDMQELREQGSLLQGVVLMLEWMSDEREEAAYSTEAGGEWRLTGNFYSVTGTLPNCTGKGKSS